MLWFIPPWWFPIAVVLYFFPVIFAYATKYKNWEAVVVLGVGLGWTGFFWWLAIWAVWEEWDWWHGR